MSSTHAIPASVPISPGDIIALRPDAPLSDAQIALTDRQLARMAEIAMERMEDLNDAPTNAEGKRLNAVQVANAVDRLTQAMRKIMALEQEVCGLREKRVAKVKNDLLRVKKTAVRQNVERSLAIAKPELAPQRREDLLRDLFSDYDSLSKGTVREVVTQICKDIGIPADLSLWEDPSVIDVTLPSGHDWILPGNGDKPYTMVTNPMGRRMRMTFDSPHLTRHGKDPPPLS